MVRRRVRLRDSIYGFHPNRKAANGFRREALRAGNTPNATPGNREGNPRRDLPTDVRDMDYTRNGEGPPRFRAPGHPDRRAAIYPLRRLLV